MALNTIEINSVFASMMGFVGAELDALYDDNKIDAEIFAMVMTKMLQSTMQLATQTVQQQPILDAQVTKANADIDFVGTQTQELERSVGFNGKIKALDAYADMIGVMGAGSLKINTAMWTTLFEMISKLNSSASTPETTDAIKVT